jgi:hypothetical protein
MQCLRNCVLRQITLFEPAPRNLKSTGRRCIDFPVSGVGPEVAMSRRITCELSQVSTDRSDRLRREDMDTSTLVLIGVIVAFSIPYLMRRRARLGRQKQHGA